MKFFKYVSTGNDFIIIKKSELGKAAVDATWVEKLCHRIEGIGADGLILVDVVDDQTVKMSYFNKDGNEVEMCGNGLRAVGRFAKEELKLKLSGNVLGIETMNSKYQLSVENFLKIKIKMTEILDVDLLDVGRYGANYINTGVPHVVKKVEDLKTFPTDKALEIRHDSIFPNGTNVNFYQELASGEINVRTFERGVEGETLSCGTGVTACAYFYLESSGLNKVQVKTRGGLLAVSKVHGELFLEGPSSQVYSGVLSSQFIKS